jgi:hypothetical protein
MVEIEGMANLFNKKFLFGYTCSSCDQFLNDVCPGDRNLYYPTECEGYSFGGVNVRQHAFEQEEQYYRELEEEAQAIMDEWDEAHADDHQDDDPYWGQSEGN